MTHSPSVRHGVARVRVSLPAGGGNVSKVKDITAGSGAVRPGGDRKPSIPPLGSVLISPQSCPSPVGTRSVQTPTLMRSLHRSNSAREFRSSLKCESSVLTSFDVLPSERPQPVVRAASRQSATYSSFGGTGVLSEEEISTPKQRSQSYDAVSMGGSKEKTPAAETVFSGGARQESLVTEGSNLPVGTPASQASDFAAIVTPARSVDSRRGSKRLSSRESQRQSSTPNSCGAPPLPRSGTKPGSASDHVDEHGADTVVRVDAARARSRSPMLPGPGARTPPGLPTSSSGPAQKRAHSEPPKRKIERVHQNASRPHGRLAQLVEDASSHLSKSVEPSDSQGWLQEIAEMELFVEELNWLIGEQERSPGALGDRFEPSRDAVRKHDVSVLRGDKDLRWVRQQLRMCELEHTNLLQRLNCVDPAAQEMQASELRAVEAEIVAEQKRQKQLAHENRQRGRSLVQNAVDGHEIDAKTRALQQLERLDAELGVWKVKNNSLHKQVQQASQMLQKAHEQRHALGQKAQHMEEVLGSEQHAARQAEQRQAQQRLHDEEASLQDSLAELQETRQQALRNHQRVKREYGKELAELVKVRKEYEERERQAEATERQLQRQLRQQEAQAHSHRGNRRSTPVSCGEHASEQ